MRHLTDSEIQAFLDSDGEDLDTELLDHLEGCKECRGILHDYWGLYARLADDAGFDAPPDLVRGVVSALGLRQRRQMPRVPADFSLVACSVIVMIIAVSVFADLGILLDAASTVGEPIIEYVGQLVDSARDGLSGANHMITILASAVTILVVVGSLDVIFAWRRRAYVTRGTR
jgi:predicted anti-sigma-YlaC factor YlaD